MKLKVVESKMSSSLLVVQDCYGEERIAPNGVKYSYEPLPLCRVPNGYGRTKDEARMLAERIATLLEEDYKRLEEDVEIIERIATAPLLSEETMPS